MTTIYIAKCEYGEPRIISIEVVKETAKQYEVDRSTLKHIRGKMYFKEYVRKADYNIFPTLHDAQTWCLAQLDMHIQHLQTHIDQAKRAIVELESEMEVGTV